MLQLRSSRKICFSIELFSTFDTPTSTIFQKIQVHNTCFYDPIYNSLKKNTVGINVPDPMHKITISTNPPPQDIKSRLMIVTGIVRLIKYVNVTN